jgi:hypothetical protein
MVEVKVPAEQMKLLFNLMFGQEPEALENFRTLQTMIVNKAIRITIPLSMPAFEQRLCSLSLDGVSTPSNPDEEARLEACGSEEGVILSANGCSERQEIADALAKASNLDGIQCCRGPWCSHFINCAMGGLPKPCGWLHAEEDYILMKKAYSAAAKRQGKKNGTSVCKTVWGKKPCSFGSKCFYIHIEIPAE